MLRRAVAALFLIGFLALLVVGRHELAAMARALAGAQSVPLLGAVLLQLASFALVAALYRGALGATGVRTGFGACAALVAGSLFVNLVAPSAGAAGAVLWVAELGRHGHARARVATGVMVAWACDLAALGALAIAAAAWTIASGHAHPLALAGALALGAGAIVIALALALAFRRPDWTRGALERWRAALAAVSRRLRRPAPLPPEWPERVTTELGEALATVRAAGLRIVVPAAAALAAHLASVFALGALAQSLGAPIGRGAVVAAYALAQVVWILAPVPQGIGAVEATLAATMVSNGVPLERAARIALGFRALTFWAPLIVGFVVTRRLRTLRES